MLVTDESREWLLYEFPGLKITPNGIFGAIGFIAAYNSVEKYFQIFKNGEEPGMNEVFLKGSFEVEIVERKQKLLSQLPAVTVRGIDPIPARHFNQKDKTACLCSPFEEDEFLFPEFSIKKFIKRLVIPFLYGQVFYSNYGKWPWPEYMHGPVGLLESYFKINDSSKAQNCVHKLVQDRQTWERIKQALEQKNRIQGHTICFCPNADQIRRCHPDAWKGIIALRKDVKVNSIRIN